MLAHSSSRSRSASGDDGYQTIENAAAYLDCSTKTVRRYITEGLLPGYRLGPRQIRVRQSDVEALAKPIEPAEAGREQ